MQWLDYALLRHTLHLLPQAVSRLGEILGEGLNFVTFSYQVVADNCFKLLP